MCHPCGFPSMRYGARSVFGIGYCSGARRENHLQRRKHHSQRAGHRFDEDFKMRTPKQVPRESDANRHSHPDKNTLRRNPNTSRCPTNCPKCG